VILPDHCHGQDKKPTLKEIKEIESAELEVSQVGRSALKETSDADG
jgi:hypothetical protein